MNGGADGARGGSRAPRRRGDLLAARRRQLFGTTAETARRPRACRRGPCRSRAASPEQTALRARSTLPLADGHVRVGLVFSCTRGCPDPLVRLGGIVRGRAT